MPSPSASLEKGRLYIVATPIGNLEDISLRAIHTLKSVDAVLAEDTRHSKPLLQALGIQTGLLSFHDHNEAQKTEAIIEALHKGKSYALISDAGTPLISDPGFVLVREARAAGIAVVPVPGASACITALSAAGVPCDSFLFAGFLPAKRPARLKALQTFKAKACTTVVYESTHRLLNALTDIEEVFKEDYVFVLAKELTKSFEAFIKGNVLQIRQWLEADPARAKGEFVLVFPALMEEVQEERAFEKKMLSVLLEELPLKQAVRLTAAMSGRHKNELYDMALGLKGE